MARALQGGCRGVLSLYFHCPAPTDIWGLAHDAHTGWFGGLERQWRHPLWRRSTRGSWGCCSCAGCRQLCGVVQGGAPQCRYRWGFCTVQGDLSRNGNGRSRPIGAPSTTERATTGERKHPRSFLGPKTAIFSLQTPKTCFSASHHHCHRRPSAGARPAQMHQTTS